MLETTGIGAQAQSLRRRTIPFGCKPAGSTADDPALIAISAPRGNTRWRAVHCPGSLHNDIPNRLQALHMAPANPSADDRWQARPVWLSNPRAKKGLWSILVGLGKGQGL